MFWKKKEPGALPGPKEIPEHVGRHLVVALKENPDWVWSLKGVVRPRPEGKHAFDFRVFDAAEAATKNIKVKDYNHLAEYPDLILFAGWFDKKTFQVNIDFARKKEEKEK